MIAREEDNPRSGTPLKFFSAGLMLTIIIVTALVVFTLVQYQAFSQTEARNVRLHELSSKIRELDDYENQLLVQAIATSDSSLRSLFMQADIEHGEALLEAREQASGAELETATDAAIAAHNAMHAKEAAIFDSILAGNYETVGSTISDPEYQRVKKEYLASIDKLTRGIQASIDADIDRSHTRILAIALVIAAVLLAIAIVWVYVLRSVRKYIEARDVAEEKMRMAMFSVASAADAIYWVNPDARFLFANEQASNWLGYSHDELMNMSVADIDPSFTEEKWASRWEELKKKKHFTIETMHRRRDGSTFPTEVTNNYLEVGGRDYNFAFARDITERKAAAAAFRDSEERYRLIFENMEEFAWSGELPSGGAGSDFSFSFISAGVQKLVGLSPEEVMEDGFSILYETLHPDDADEVTDSTAALIARGESGTRTYRVRHRDTGEYIWLEETVTPRIGAGGEVTGLFGVARDITERKHFEELLMDVVEGVSGDTGLHFFQSLVSQLRKALDSDIAFVGELNQEGDSVTTIAVDNHGDPAVNFEYKLAGTPCENVVGKAPCVYPSNVRTLFPDDEDLVKLDVEAYIGTPLFDSAGRPQGIIVVLYHRAIDDTETATKLTQIFASRAAAELERLGIELALMRSEEKYRTLFEESKDAVFMASAEGRFLDMNEAGIELLGYDSLEEVRQLDLATDVYAEAADSDRYQRDLAEAGFVKDYEIRLKRKDGEIRTFAVTSTLVRDEEGNITGSWGIGRDITSHRRLEEQIIQAQKMESIGRLAGGVAHDFNNFLTAVQGYIEMAITDLPEGSPVRPELVEAARSADRAVDVTRQLLLFSRHGRMDLRAIDLNLVVESILNMLKRLIGEQYQITTDLDPQLPSVMADPGHIEQVLLNLVVNARDAMVGGGKILVGTQRYSSAEPVTDFAGEEHFGEFVYLWVQDQGEGMDETTRARAFEPFFSTKSVGTGTGLGLSVVYGIVEQHDGWVEVESEPGLGSTFRVYLPVATEESQDEGEPAGAPVSSLHGKGERVLLVEDEDIVRNLAMRMLGENGYKVSPAADAAAAMSLFSESPDAFHVLFSDVVLPDMSGVRLADELTAAQPGLSVILASGYTGEEVDHTKIEAMGYSYLQKPYSLQDLLQLFARVLRARND